LEALPKSNRSEEAIQSTVADTLFMLLGSFLLSATKTLTRVQFRLPFLFVSTAFGHHSLFSHISAELQTF